MSLLDTLKGLFAGGTDETAPSSRMHIIDTSGFTANGGRDRLSPRQQFAMVQDLAAFAEKEKIRACAILEGRPLREVADRSDFKGMKVYYAEQGSNMALDMAGKHRGAVLITQNREVEKKAHSSGIQTLRASTLRKAVEDQGSRGDTARSGGGRGRGGARRSSRNRRGNGGERGQRPSRQEQRPSQDKPKEQPAKEAKDGVSDLIDLV